MWNRARAALEEARAMGVSTNYSAWFGGATNASAAVLAPAQVAAIAPLVRVTAAYVVMYYAFCFFQSWSKLYLCASRRPKPTYTPSTRPAIDATHAIDETQAADSAPERRRQEADAHAAEIRQLWFKQDADAAVVG
jgi:nucleotide-binding universal stress UspA family protein